MTSKDYLDQYVKPEIDRGNSIDGIKNLSDWLARYSNTEMVVKTIVKMDDFDSLTGADIEHFQKIIRENGKEIFDFNFSDVLYMRMLLNDPGYVSLEEACEKYIRRLAEMPVEDRKAYNDNIVSPQIKLKDAYKRSIRNKFETLLFYASENDNEEDFKL